MGTFSDFVTIFFVMLEQNLIISLPTYPKFCWYATGTTHIFHLGPIETSYSTLLSKSFAQVIKMNLYVSKLFRHEISDEKRPSQ